VSGKPQLRFNYAVLASWAPSGVPNPTINDFPPQANLQEAIHISITDNGSDLYYVDSSNFGGSLHLLIEVFDWQGASNVGGFIDEIAAIYIEAASGIVIPGGSVNLLPTATSAPGTGNSSVYMVDIANCTPQGSGTQEFLITVESAAPTDYNNGLGAPYPNTAKLSAFMRYTATVFNYNPCPTPTLASVSQPIITLNSNQQAFAFTGTNFETGTDLAAEFRRTSGDVVGTSVTVLSSTSAQADFDFNGFSAGMYDLYFKNGCGTEAALLTSALEVNTPPSSTGITGPSNGDGNMVGSYNSNATDADTDPVDVLSFTWEVWDMIAMVKIIGPVSGDPFTLPFLNLPIGPNDVRCLVSDGFVPDDLNLAFLINRANTQPTVTDPTGPTSAWAPFSVTFNVVASDIDPGQILSYSWSCEPAGNPQNYIHPGDPIPGDFTVNFATMPSYAGSGLYVIDCRVDDNGGYGNSTATCTNPLVVYVGNPPYTDPIPIGMFNQLVSVPPSTIGIVGCPSYWDGFFQPGTPVQHPDICVLSGPSLGVPGIMVLGDELGALVPLAPPPPFYMAFVHYPCPYISMMAPSWWWFTAARFPAGPGLAPSTVHFDGNINAEFLITNSSMTNMIPGVPDPSAFEFYDPLGALKVSDLYTSLNSINVPDVAVDATSGFDMGSPSTPDNPPLYGLFIRDASGIIASCGGPVPSPMPPANPVHVMMFPSGGVQPAGTPVDAAGSMAVVAPIPAALTGAGPGLLNYGTGGPSPGGAIIFPEPYFALAVDDDDLDNFFPTNLPPPVTQRVMIGIIDSDRDLEIYEADFGVPAPGPAPIMPFATMPMGSFMGGIPTAYPLDCEFISNFSGFGGTPKPVWPDDMIAVLLTEPVGGFWCVEVFQLAPGVPVSVAISMPVPVPPTLFNVPGVAYRLDVDEVTGDIYVIHIDITGATTGQAVTMIQY